MKKVLRKHRPRLLALLAIALLSLSFALLWSRQDWLTFEDEEVRLSVSHQMREFEQVLEEYNTPEGRQKIRDAKEFLAGFSLDIDTEGVYEKAREICSALRDGGVSLMNLRVFLEVGVTADQILRVPLDVVSFILDRFGMGEALTWLTRFQTLLSHTGQAMGIYDVMYWTVLSLFVLSILLMLLDTWFGPIPFVLVNLLSVLGVYAISVYVEQKIGLKLVLTPAGAVAFGFSLASLVLWTVLGIVQGVRNRKKP